MILAKKFSYFCNLATLRLSVFIYVLLLFVEDFFVTARSLSSLLAIFVLRFLACCSCVVANTPFSYNKYVCHPCPHVSSVMLLVWNDAIELP